MPAPTFSPVAIIDIGSNSIKCLVASPGPDHRVQALYTRTIECRISAGISRDQPRLSAASITAGVAAIQQLLRDIEHYAPQHIEMVATSAVRDAGNRAEFVQAVLTATRVTPRILSGEEEATYIARGIACDPALDGTLNLTVFDIGGGSMEAITLEDGSLTQAISMPLGAVRMTEKHFPHPEQPISTEAVEALQRAAIATLEKNLAPLPATGLVAGTGGGFTVARMMLGARTGKNLEQSSPELKVQELQHLLELLAALPLSERKQIPGLPPERADILPAALATILALARYAEIRSFTHSFYNLRYGLAQELLSR